MEGYTYQPELQQYAHLRDGLVDMVELRTQQHDIALSDLYHPDLLPEFIEIPYELWDRVYPGWRVEDGVLIDPLAEYQEYLAAMQEVIEA